MSPCPPATLRSDCIEESQAKRYIKAVIRSALHFPLCPALALQEGTCGETP